jgi:hypothetical protein
LRFSVRAKHRKMLSTENGFLKNDFPETILRRKPFYVETNGALGGSVSLLFCKWELEKQYFFYLIYI